MCASKNIDVYLEVYLSYLLVIKIKIIKYILAQNNE